MTAYIVVLDGLYSPTIRGPIRNDAPIPRYGKVDAKPVAVIRSLTGNQVAEREVTAPIMTGPDRPIKMWPKWTVLVRVTNDIDILCVIIIQYNST